MTLRKETRETFNKICAEKGAIFMDGLPNPILIQSNTATVYILQRKMVYECIIDTKNIEKIKGYGVWVGTNSKASAKVRPITSKRVLMYHLFIKPHSGYVTDHINQNSLDNRMCNLRLVTPGVNMLNKGNYTSNTSGHKNIMKTEEGYMLALHRKFESLDIAIQAQGEIVKILDEYSNMDATKRTPKEIAG